MPRADVPNGMSAVALVEHWEIHSELVLVSPEVYERARELLPERDPDAFLVRSARVGAKTDAERVPGLPTALVTYTVFRMVVTARSGLIVVGFVVALALIAQISH